MSRMVQLINELRQRLNTIVDTEQTLIASLDDALNRFDQKLLQDVRNITSEHEARRGVILRELQILASRMGAFPAARTLPNKQNGDGADRHPSLPPGAAVEDVAWRDSANRLAIELDIYFRKRRASV